MSCLHRGQYIQRGRGIGSTLSSFFRGVLPAMKVMGRKILSSPITKQVLDVAKNSAVEAGFDVTKDVLEGKKIKDSLVNRVTTAKKAVTTSLLSALDKAKSQKAELPKVGLRAPKKRKLNPSPTTNKHRRYRRQKDIFDSNFS